MQLYLKLLQIIYLMILNFCELCKKIVWQRGCDSIPFKQNPYVMVVYKHFITQKRW